MKNNLKRMAITVLVGVIATVSATAKENYVAYLFTYFTGNAPEKEQICYAERMRNGIPLNISTVAEMKSIAEELEMDVVAYLGDVDVSQARLFSYEKKRE